MAEQFTSYEVENDEKFQAAIDKAIRTVGNLRIPFELISDDFYKSEKAIFQLKSAGKYPDFGGLRPNERVRWQGELVSKREVARIKKREEVGFDYPLLKRSGKLMRAVTKPNAKGSINEIRKDSLTIGTNLPYAVFHQSDKARTKMPLRKFLFIGPEAKRFANSNQVGRLKRWVGIMEDFVLSASEAFGGN